MTDEMIEQPVPEPAPTRHRRSSLVVSSTFTGRFCLDCQQPWPCPGAPADGSDGWDDDV